MLFDRNEVFGNVHVFRTPMGALALRRSANAVTFASCLASAPARTTPPNPSGRRSARPGSGDKTRWKEGHTVAQPLPGRFPVGSVEHGTHLGFVSQKLV